MSQKQNPNSTFIQVQIAQNTILAYIDTGASLCIIKKQNLPNNLWKRLKRPINIRIADKRVIQITKAAVFLTIVIAERKFILPAVYQFDSGVPMIIGNNFLRLYHPFCQYLDYITLRCPQMNNQKQETIKIEIFHSPTKQVKLLLHSMIATIEEQKLEEDIKVQLEERFSSDLLGIKNTNTALIEIKLRNPQQEVAVPNNIPYTKRDIEEFKEDMDDLIKKGVIRPSNSPHSAPAFYVENHAEEKRKKRRIVINYKKMNEATIGTPKSLPRKDFLLSKLKGQKWFSTLDVKSAYWQLRLHENTKPLTAFTFPPQKHYEWNSLPLGLKQAPGIFQDFMNNQIEGLEYCCAAYIDDIIIFSDKDRKHHLQQVTKVIQRCKDRGIILSQPKAIIGKDKIDFLGLTISSGSILLQPHILEKLHQFPDVMENRKQLQRFLGNLNYISDQGFLKNLAKLRKPLQKKLSEKILWTWSAKDSDNIKQLKASCKELPQLYNLQEQDLIIVSTDASHGYWGAIMTAVTQEYLQDYQSVNSVEFINEPHTKLSQILATKAFQSHEKLAKYTSGTFTDTETRYPIHQKETLAVLRSFKKWKIDLLPKTFILKTDSKYVTGFLKYDLKADYGQGRLVRWQLALSQYDFKTFFIRSEDNYGPDTLTREWKE